jgi:TRAP-type mannitol/chloroaromatic compound transport system permease large subunit
MELVFLLLLIVLMIWALGSGFPVAFSLPGSAILAIGAAAFFGWLFAGDASAYFAQGGPWQWLTAGVTNFRGIYWEAERDTLIAIPLFVFMGIMLQRSKIAEDLLVTMAQLFGPMPGGLGISVVFVGALLAATTGIVGATVVAMGLISLPAMMRNKYSNSLATGTIAASGTLGQIIPPSIVLIILADQLASAVDQASTTRKGLYKEATGQIAMPSEFDIVSTSAGDMFMGAFIPGLVLVGLYMLFILLLSLLRPHMAPAVHFAGKYDAKFALRVLLILVPPLALIFVVLGSIIMGVATVNQAGAIGAVGATIMAGYRLREGKARAYWPAILSIGQEHQYRRRCRRADSGDRHGGWVRCFGGLELLANANDGKHPARGDGRYRQDDVSGIHHPARRGDADSRIPRFRRRGTGQGFPHHPAGRFLGPVHHRHGGDLRPRLLPGLHRSASPCSTCGASRPRWCVRSRSTRASWPSSACNFSVSPSSAPAPGWSTSCRTGFP